MQIFARPELATNVPFDERPRLLLEGSWPLPKARGRSSKDLALDDLIDGRDALIDQEAERLAERIAVACQRPEAGRPSFADVNILRLRYAAVKWLRPLAWRRSLPVDARPSGYELYVSSAADDAEYVALWHAIAAVDDCELRIVDSSAASTMPCVPSETGSRCRSWLSRQLGRLVPSILPADSHARVLLCGNPRLLDPICRELVRRRIQTAWLYDSFPIRSGLRWAWRGVPTFTCNAPSISTALPLPQLGESIRYDRLDLTEVVRCWIERIFAEVGSAQDHRLRKVDRLFGEFRPTHLLVDEDATPLKRIAVATAREHGVRSSVVQHGACAIRFGFAPLKADCFLAADDGSQRQLTEWGVEPPRITVTGSPSRAQFATEIRAARTPVASSPKKRVLLLGTTPPRDRRPDAVEYHFTPRTYEQMLAAACAAVAERSDCELIIRRHPRSVSDPSLQAVLKKSPSLRYAVASKRSSLAQLVASADCVLSCGSSAGVEAAAAGIPVVQLLPEGSGNLLPAEWYGLLGTARTLDELRPLLQRALCGDATVAGVPQATAEQLASRLVDAALFPVEAKPAPHFALTKTTEARRV